MLTLDVRDLSVDYGSRRVLSDISFSVNAGELVCAVGQNAAGKTTLFKAIAGLTAHGGSVELNEDGKRLPQSSIAYLPQLTQVKSRLSVFEMVMLGLGRSLSWRVTPDIIDRVDETLHAMEIAHLSAQPVAALSGGQKQLVFMAQAFVSRPRVLLLDEPTSALDLRHQLIVMEAARAYAQRTGSIAIAIVHDLMLAARFSTRLLMLANGTLRRYASPAEVLTPEEISAVYRVEASVERSTAGVLTVIPERALDTGLGHGHGHDHDHDHDHAHGHFHAHDHAHPHVHSHAHPHTHSEAAAA
ncbi:ABC transporter ATP-binding protein [Sutterella sp.]|uniref:ABC transporter ATP-binding protein n=1 Tax=Sutterella sp. TaxID=1981025 RepID=UPI0026DF06A7|nr:ABC transporter ATP-binding protein [Sutterella sp.]MDO5530905.1 ABC transporter ATP-binding protein [Sutterella sp.]